MTEHLKDKQILLGVCGSIAAYKAAELCSSLSKLGANTHVVLTSHGAEFVGVPTFRSLTRNPVITDIFEEPESHRIAHIDLAQKADLIVVAPASANMLAKMATGIADDMLSTCLLAAPSETPILVAPAMNTAMWDHPATQANLRTLMERGVQLIQPNSGLLACQDIGVGKLADVGDILAAIEERLSRKEIFKGYRFLITAGATREPLDPVRFLSNRSSGKMGYAIASEAANQGGIVTLISGFATANVAPGVELICVNTASEMMEACRLRFAESDVFIAAAAVSDYTPYTVADRKLKKSDSLANNAVEEMLLLRLQVTEDILATLSKLKHNKQLVVGFAAESEDILLNAERKLHEKKLDMIVANDISLEGAGFDVDTNIVTLLWRDGRKESLPIMSKRDVARRLLAEIETLRKSVEVTGC